jgi:hypothetical protein
MANAGLEPKCSRSPRGQENHDDEVSATIGSSWIHGCTSVTAYE